MGHLARNTDRRTGAAKSQGSRRGRGRGHAECPWCIDAHTTMLYAAGDSATATAILADKDPSDADPNAPYVAWARGTAAPGGPAAPFGPEDAAEYVGTATIFHFVTRLVLVLLDETFLPGGPRAQSLARRAAGLAFARKVRATSSAGRGRRAARCPTTAGRSGVARRFGTRGHFVRRVDRLPRTSRSTCPKSAAAVVRDAVQAWRGEHQAHQQQLDGGAHRRSAGGTAPGHPPRAVDKPWPRTR